MTPAQKKRMEELAESKYGEERRDVRVYKEGYTQAMSDADKIMQEMAEAFGKINPSVGREDSESSLADKLRKIQSIKNIAIEKYKQWKAGNG